ncbi:uncharacterized protein AB675_1208 [Cyphellophora attinorum]|uniref:Uncharacterized protein n=1 Tax=Cyphellophora attinorum TaxID=1664694 RepID=A0A0N1NW16_9EURO|nr:uncharacterized protein AB675_1208 [Phialophora attinorum]KPI35754.1 hypothetical protein AB675_1208 [Phialophora attinorum]
MAAPFSPGATFVAEILSGAIQPNVQVHSGATEKVGDHNQAAIDGLLGMYSEGKKDATLQAPPALTSSHAMEEPQSMFATSADQPTGSDNDFQSTGVDFLQLQPWPQAHSHQHRTPHSSIGMSGLLLERYSQNSAPATMQSSQPYPELHRQIQQLQADVARLRPLEAENARLRRVEAENARLRTLEADNERLRNHIKSISSHLPLAVSAVPNASASKSTEGVTAGSDAEDAEADSAAVQKDPGKEVPTSSTQYVLLREADISKIVSATVEELKKTISAEFDARQRTSQATFEAYQKNLETQRESEKEDAQAVRKAWEIRLDTQGELTDAIRNSMVKHRDQLARLEGEVNHNSALHTAGWVKPADDKSLRTKLKARLPGSRRDASNEQPSSHPQPIGTALAPKNQMPNPDKRPAADSPTDSREKSASKRKKIKLTSASLAAMVANTAEGAKEKVKARFRPGRPRYEPRDAHPQRGNLRELVDYMISTEPRVDTRDVHQHTRPPATGDRNMQQPRVAAGASDGQLGRPLQAEADEAAGSVAQPAGLNNGGGLQASSNPRPLSGFKARPAYQGNSLQGFEERMHSYVPDQEEAKEEGREKKPSESAESGRPWSEQPATPPREAPDKNLNA